MLRLRWIWNASNDERKDVIGCRMPSKARGSGRSKVRQCHALRTVALKTGAAPQGQASTTLAQPAKAQYLHRQLMSLPATLSLGVGTFASRIAVNAGCRFITLKQYGKLMKLAAAVLQVGEDDLEMEKVKSG